VEGAGPASEIRGDAELSIFHDARSATDVFTVRHRISGSPADEQVMRRRSTGYVRETASERLTKLRCPTPARRRWEDGPAGCST